MTVTVQSGSIASYAGTYPTTAPLEKNLNIVVGAGVNRVAALLVTGGANNGVMLATGWNVPTFDGSAMTLHYRQASGAWGVSGLWYFIIPDAMASGTYVMKISSTSNFGGTSISITGLVLNDVDATTPFGTAVAYSTSSSPASPVTSSISTPADGLALTAHAVYGTGAGINASAGQTVLAGPGTFGSLSFVHSYKAAAANFGMTFTTSNQAAQLGVPVNPAASPPQAAVSVTTDAAVFSGSAEPGNSSQATVAIATDAALFAGSAGTVAANLTTSPFKNNTGSVLAGLSGLTVAVIRMSDFSLAGVFTGQTTNGAGVLTINSTSITADIEYAVVTRNAAGALGVEKYTATP